MDNIFNTVPENKLKELVANSSSRAEIFRKLHLRASGASYKTFNTKIQELKIDISHFQRGFKYGPRPTLTNDQIFTANSKISANTVRRRILIENLFPYKCVECGQLPLWNNKPLTLQLDHINGIRNDHRLENLRFLCPHCHTQTKTFGGKKHKKIHICPSCLKDYPGYGKFCRQCTNAQREPIIQLPPKEELEKLVWQIPCKDLAQKLGYSESGFRKRLETLKIPAPSSGYWQRIKAGKSHEQALLPPPTRPKLKLLTKNEIQEIKNLASQGISFRKIGKKFDRSHQIISNVVNNKSYTSKWTLQQIQKRERQNGGRRIGVAPMGSEDN